MMLNVHYSCTNTPLEACQQDLDHFSNDFFAAFASPAFHNSMASLWIPRPKEKLSLGSLEKADGGGDASTSAFSAARKFVAVFDGNPPEKSVSLMIPAGS